MEAADLEAVSLAMALASKLIYCEQSDADCDEYSSKGFFDASPFGQGDPSVEGGLAMLRTASADGTLSAEDLKSDWFMLFVGAGVPKAPSWAGYYLDADSKIMSEYSLRARRIYKRYGFEPCRVNSEPDDNLGIMLGFLGYLISLEDEYGDGAIGVDDVRNDQIEILETLILPWIARWRWDVAHNAKTTFFRGVGDFVFGIVKVYSGRFGFRYTDSGNPRFVRVS